MTQDRPHTPLLDQVKSPADLKRLSTQIMLCSKGFDIFQNMLPISCTEVHL